MTAHPTGIHWICGCDMLSSTWTGLMEEEDSEMNHQPLSHVPATFGTGSSIVLPHEIGYWRCSGYSTQRYRLQCECQLRKHKTDPASIVESTRKLPPLTCPRSQSYFASGSYGAGNTSTSSIFRKAPLSRRRRFALITGPLDGAWTFTWRGSFSLQVNILHLLSVGV